MELDKENGNTLWQDAITKEMYEVGMAFKILEDGEPLQLIRLFTSKIL